MTGAIFFATSRAGGAIRSQAANKEEPMRRLALYLIVGIVGFVQPPGRAHASECVVDARQDYRECKDSCKGDFLNAKAACRGVSPGCYLACRDGKLECIATAEQSLTSCLDTCKPPLVQARHDCKVSCNCGNVNVPDDGCGFNPCYIDCINPAQAAAFTCRDNCRDAFRSDPDNQANIEACRSGFRACLDACPPAP
jgi:hypothetical protein